MKHPRTNAMGQETNEDSSAKEDCVEAAFSNENAEGQVSPTYQQMIEERQGGRFTSRRIYKSLSLG